MSRTLRVISEPADAESTRISGHRVGQIVAFESGRWSVSYDAALGALPARTTLTLDEATMQAAAQRAREVLLVFADEDPTRPIVIGLLDDGPREAEPARPLHPDGFDAVVDGKRVLLEGHDEIVLRCGEASVTLRRNGRVIIRGARIETRARGVNRIKGGSVQIN